MNKSMFKSADFFYFCNSDNNRLVSLKNILDKQYIPFSQITLAGINHLVIKFPSSTYSPLYKIKTIIAHYDRTINSPGANDNSAVIFQLIEFIKQIQLSTDTSNVRIIFTGGEELTQGESVKKQGAFALGQGLKKLGCDKDELYVLDCCGRGDTLVTSQTGILKNNHSQKLHQTAIQLCEKAVKKCTIIEEKLENRNSIAENIIKWGHTSLPVPYGDNAGLIASGLVCQAITLLPHTEVTEIQNTIEKNRFSTNFAVNLSHCKTWQLINTQNDTPETLNDYSCVIMEALLSEIRERKVNAF